jgi:hypothetical protein
MRPALLPISRTLPIDPVIRCLALAALVVIMPLSVAQAQTPAPTDPPSADDPFAEHQLRVEVAGDAGFEAWNFNDSHEQLYGGTAGVSYGLGHGVAFKADQRTRYVAQRGPNSLLMGVTMGLRGRIHQGSRVTAFIEMDVGASYATVATPPNGTRFNWLAIGGPGMLVRLTPRMQLAGTVMVTHVSNGNFTGVLGRNPDIEAIGPAVGLLIGF